MKKYKIVLIDDDASQSEFLKSQNLNTQLIYAEIEE